MDIEKLEEMYERRVRANEQMYERTARELEEEYARMKELLMAKVREMETQCIQTVSRLQQEHERLMGEISERSAIAKAHYYRSTGRELTEQDLANEASEKRRLAEAPEQVLVPVYTRNTKPPPTAEDYVKLWEQTEFNRNNIHTYIPEQVAKVDRLYAKLSQTERGRLGVEEKHREAKRRNQFTSISKSAQDHRMLREYDEANPLPDENKRARRS